MFSSRYFQFHGSSTIRVFCEKQTRHEADIGTIILLLWPWKTQAMACQMSAYLRRYLQLSTSGVDFSLQPLCKTLGMHCFISRYICLCISPQPWHHVATNPPAVPKTSQSVHLCCIFGSNDDTNASHPSPWPKDGHDGRKCTIIMATGGGHSHQVKFSVLRKRYRLLEMIVLVQYYHRAL